MFKDVDLFQQQVCIPVGCVPLACLLYPVVSGEGCHRGRLPGASLPREGGV